MSSKLVPQRSLQMVVHTWNRTIRRLLQRRGTILFLLILSSQSSSHNSTVPLPNPFDVRRLMLKSKPTVEVASEDGEPAPYYPVPINHPPSDGSAVPTYNKPKSKSILRMSFKKSRTKGFCPSVLQERQEQGHSICHECICHYSRVCLSIRLSTTLVGFYI